MAKSKSKFKSWYDDPKNRAALNKRRREKYRENKAYRNRVLESTKKWRKEQAAERKRNPPKPKPKTIFTIGEVAQIIGCEQKTIRTLEKQGLIPKQADGKKHRRYTKGQIKLIRSIVNLRKTIHYRNPDYAVRLKAHSLAAHALWG